jgi:hypothetical protein
MQQSKSLLHLRLELESIGQADARCRQEDIK